MAEAENVKLKDRISNFKVTAGNAIESGSEKLAGMNQITSKLMVKI